MYTNSGSLVLQQFLFSVCDFFFLCDNWTVNSWIFFVAGKKVSDFNSLKKMLNYLTVIFFQED